MEINFANDRVFELIKSYVTYVFCQDLCHVTYDVNIFENIHYSDYYYVSLWNGSNFYQSFSIFEHFQNDMRYGIGKYINIKGFIYKLNSEQYTELKFLCEKHSRKDDNFENLINKLMYASESN